MRIKDAMAKLNDNSSVIEYKDGIHILADDGRTLFDISLNNETGALRVSSGIVCKHNGKMLDDPLIIEPSSCNRLRITRQEYKESK